MYTALTAVAVDPPRETRAAGATGGRADTAHTPPVCGAGREVTDEERGGGGRGGALDRDGRWKRACMTGYVRWILQRLSDLIEGFDRAHTVHDIIKAGLHEKHTSTH